jgi:thymidylate synthase
MNKLDEQYLNLLRDIKTNGIVKGDRTGVGTKSVFGREIRLSMKDGFPLLTSKKMFTKGIIYELIWFLRGDTNIKYLIDNDVNIWNGDAYNYYKRVRTNWLNSKATNSMENLLLKEPLSMEDFLEGVRTQKESDSQFGIGYKYGDLGPIYGAQWTSWGKGDLLWQEISYNTGVLIAKPDPVGINQISNLVNELKTNPDSRRLIVNAWNVSDVPKCALPPCHYGFECWTRELTEFERGELYNKKFPIQTDELKMTSHYDEANIPKREISLKWLQRSVDTCLGLPYNISSYAFLLHMLAQQANMIPGDLIGSLGDTHIYNNQLDIVDTQLSNETFDLCKLELSPANSIFDYEYSNFNIIDYKSAGKVNYPLSN